MWEGQLDVAARLLVTLPRGRDARPEGGCGEGIEGRKKGCDRPELRRASTTPAILLSLLSSSAESSSRGGPGSGSAAASAAAAAAAAYSSKWEAVMAWDKSHELEQYILANLDEGCKSSTLTSSSSSAAAAPAPSTGQNKRDGSSASVVASASYHGTKIAARQQPSGEEEMLSPSDFERANPAQRLSAVASELRRLELLSSKGESFLGHPELIDELEILLPILLSRIADLSVRRVVVSLLQVCGAASSRLVRSIVSNDPMSLDSAISGIMDVVQMGCAAGEASKAARSLAELSPMAARFVRLQLVRHSLLPEVCIHITTEILRDPAQYLGMAATSLVRTTAASNSKMQSEELLLTPLARQIGGDLLQLGSPASAKELAEQSLRLRSLAWLLLLPQNCSFAFFSVKNAMKLITESVNMTPSSVADSGLLHSVETASIFVSFAIALALHGNTNGDESHFGGVIVLLEALMQYQDSSVAGPAILAALHLYLGDTKSIHSLCMRLCECPLVHHDHATRSSMGENGSTPPGHFKEARTVALRSLLIDKLGNCSDDGDEKCAKRICDLLLAVPPPQGCSLGKTSYSLECMIVALGEGLPIGGSALTDWVYNVVKAADTPIHPVLPHLLAHCADRSLADGGRTPPIMPNVILNHIQGVDWRSLWLAAKGDSDGLACGCLQASHSERRSLTDHGYQDHERIIPADSERAIVSSALLLYFAFLRHNMALSSDNPFITPYVYCISSLPLRWLLQITSSTAGPWGNRLLSVHRLLLAPILDRFPELFCPADSLRRDFDSYEGKFYYYDDINHDILSTLAYSGRSKAVVRAAMNADSYAGKPEVVAASLRVLLSCSDEVLLELAKPFIDATLGLLCDWCEHCRGPSPKAADSKRKPEEHDDPMEVETNGKRDASKRGDSDRGRMRDLEAEHGANLSSSYAVMWKRLHSIHPTPPSLEGLTINILAQRGGYSGMKRGFTVEALTREPLIIFRCRAAAFQDPNLFSVVLTCLRSFLLASHAAVDSAIKIKCAISHVVAASPATDSSGATPPLASTAGHLGGGAIVKEEEQQQKASTGAGGGVGGGGESSSAQCISPAFSPQEALLKIQTPHGVSAVNERLLGESRTGGGPISPADADQQAKLFLRIQNIVVIRCLLNICCLASSESWGWEGEGRRQEEDDKMVIESNSLNITAEEQQVKDHEALSEALRPVQTIQALLTREEACGLVQLIIAEDPCLAQILILQRCPLVVVGILLDHVPAFCKPAEDALWDFLRDMSLVKRVYAIKAAALFALKRPQSQPLLQMCREAIKAGGSLTIAAIVGAPYSTVVLLGQLGEPLSLIGAMYPSLAGEALSLIDKMLQSDTFSQKRHPEVHESLLEARKSLLSAGSIGTWSDLAALRK